MLIDKLLKILALFERSRGFQRWQSRHHVDRSQLDSWHQLRDGNCRPIFVLFRLVIFEFLLLGLCILLFLIEVHGVGDRYLGEKLILLIF